MEQINYRHHVIEVAQEECPMNPREDSDNLGTFMMAHNRYEFGDQAAPRDLGSWGEVKAQALRDHDVAAILPVYMLDHSGITISTTKFSCPWDSGQIGYIFVTKPQAREWFGYKVITAKRKEALRASLISEIETLDSYVSGQMYAYTVKKLGGEPLEDGAHAGYCGYDHEKSGLLADAKSEIDAELNTIGEQMEMMFKEEAANV